MTERREITGNEKDRGFIIIYAGVRRDVLEMREGLAAEDDCWQMFFRRGAGGGVSWGRFDK